MNRVINMAVVEYVERNLTAAVPAEDQEEVLAKSTRTLARAMRMLLEREGRKRDR